MPTTIKKVKINNPINKLIPSSMQNYLKEKDLNLTIGKEVYIGFKAMSVATLKL